MARAGNSRVAILLYENDTFFAAACSSQGTVEDSTSMKGGMNTLLPNHIPHELVVWLKKRNCLRVRILAELSPRKVLFSPPPGLSAYELEKSIGFEYAAVTGAAPGSMRGAAMPTRTIHGEGEGLYAFGCPEDLLQPLRNSCEENGLVFEGVGALVLTWIQARSAHASAGENTAETLVYLGGKSSYLLAEEAGKPDAGLRSINTGYLSLGTDDWASLFGRRAKGLEGATLKVLSCRSLPDDFAARLSEHVTLARVVELNWSEELKKICSFLASGESAPFSPTHPLVAMVPQKKGEVTAGHLFSGLMLLLCLGGALAFWGYHFVVARGLTTLVNQDTANQGRQKELGENLKATRSEIEKQSELRAILERPDRIERKFLEVLSAIREVIPEKTRVSRVSFNKDDLKIEGYYWSQEDLADFGARLQEELSPIGYRVIPEYATRETGTGGVEKSRRGKFSLRLVK